MQAAFLHGNRVSYALDAWLTNLAHASYADLRPTPVSHASLLIKAGVGGGRGRAREGMGGIYLRHLRRGTIEKSTC